MVTLFSIPKPFCGEFLTIQENAIQSWQRLYPDCEIILFGNEAGVAQAAAKFRVRHEPEVARNEYGTPLLNDLFARAQNITRYSAVCYINTDIILMSDFINAVRRIIDRPQFLMIGQRQEADISGLWDFADVNWEANLKNSINPERHQPLGVDYFVFSRGLYRDIPPFAIGRLYWDHWLVYWAIKLGVPVFDATPATIIVHQNHSYSPSQALTSPEGMRNGQLAGMVGREFILFPPQSANWIIYPDGIKPALTPAHLWRRLLIAMVLHPPFHPFLLLVKQIRRRQLGRPVGW